MPSQPPNPGVSARTSQTGSLSLSGAMVHASGEGLVAVVAGAGTGWAESKGVEGVISCV